VKPEAPAAIADLAAAIGGGRQKDSMQEPTRPTPRGGVRAIARAALALGLTAAAGRAGDIPFDQLAQRFVEEHGLAVSESGPVGVDAALERAFVHVRLGLFEVYFPATDLATTSDRLKDSALALLDEQELFLEWMEPVIGKPREAAKDLDTLRRWVRSWKTVSGQGLAKLRDAGGGDLYVLTEAKEPVTTAGARFATYMASGAPVGVERAQPTPARLCLMPTRKGFVELLAFAGRSDPALRPTFWQDAVADWTMAFLNDLQIVALEYAARTNQKGVYERGEGMNEGSPTGMQEQVVQLATNGLCEQYLGARAPKAFSQGLAMNLVIDLYDEIVTRVDGDLRANATAPIEVFIPGGASEGGVLPGISAESRWRELQGSDHFVSVLRLAQQEGAKNAGRSSERNRPDCFAIRSDNGGDIHVVCAPLLGSAAAESTKPPEAFQGDYREFLRAYKSCFMYWLQHHAVRKKADERFAELLQRIADPQGGGFEEAFAALYDGVPLSGKEGDQATLEEQFLAWLSRQK
jgi:hypothetical protein